MTTIGWNKPYLQEKNPNKRAVRVRLSNKFLCPVCNFLFKSDEAYKLHYKEKHGKKVG